MKRSLTRALGLMVAGTLVSVIPPSAPAWAQPDGVSRNSVVLNPQTGWDVSTASLDYSKSPAIVGTANQLSRWTCGTTFALPPGPEKIWYTTSTDGGHTWQGGNAVLAPGSPGQPDSGGVCDPSIVQIGTFYYLAYTGTSAAGGHAVFVARSSSPTGPFAKWNGAGWSTTTAAEPVIAPTASGYGSGGPSLVVVDSVLSLYYGYHDGSRWQTRLSTVGVASGVDTWPTRLQDQGTVIEHPGFDPKPCGNNSATDSTDVKYVDALDRYVAVTSDTQTFKLSTIQTWESEDGIDFTRSITKRGDFQPNTMNVSLVGDKQGHVTAATTQAVAYTSGGTTCPPAKVRISPIQLGTAKTGWVDEPLESSATNWTASGGTWSFDNNRYQVIRVSGEMAVSRLNNAVLGSSYDLDLDVGLDFGWAGVQFGQTNPSDTWGDSGYLLRIGFTGVVTLRKAGIGDVAAGFAAVPLAFDDPAHLKVVVSNGDIKVYVAHIGSSADGSSIPVLEFEDADAPYLGGYLSLAASYEAAFADVRVTDNIPPTATGDDWHDVGGNWSVPAPGQHANADPAGGQSFLSDWSLPTLGYASQFGDGTYTATIRLIPNPFPLSWAGINITNSMTTRPLSWGGGGYLVFLRQNGSLGLYKAGTGQIGSDYPTGTQPAVTPVRLRIVKRGDYLQVYVNDNQLPTINYRDLTASPQVGGFGLASLGSGAIFTDIQYAADNGV